MSDSTDAARRPADDTRCPTCGGSAHALSAIAAAKFGGREYQHRYARKRLDEAWDESDRLANELDSTYAHLRAVIENCKHTDSAAIRHQLVGLLPEVQTFDPDVAARMRENGLGHLVERGEWLARGNWSDYGYGEPPEGWERKT